MTDGTLFRVLSTEAMDVNETVLLYFVCTFTEKKKNKKNSIIKYSFDNWLFLSKVPSIYRIPGENFQIL